MCRRMGDWLVHTPGSRLSPLDHRWPKGDLGSKDRGPTLLSALRKPVLGLTKALGASDNSQNTSMGLKYPESNPSSTIDLQCDLESVAFPLCSSISKSGADELRPSWWK